MPFQSSLSLYQCTVLPICTVATVQLLYAIPILTVTISVHTVTNMYGSHSCQSDVPVIQYILLVRCNATFTRSLNNASELVYLLVNLTSSPLPCQYLLPIAVLTSKQAYPVLVPVKYPLALRITTVPLTLLRHVFGSLGTKP